MPDRQQTLARKCPACGAPMMEPQPKVMPGHSQQMSVYYRCGSREIASGVVTSPEQWEWAYIGAVACDYIDRLRAALMYHVEGEDGPCRLDHHGYCQDHGSFEDGECMVRQHRRLLGLELNDG